MKLFSLLSLSGTNQNSVSCMNKGKCNLFTAKKYAQQNRYGKTSVY